MNNPTMQDALAIIYKEHDNPTSQAIASEVAKRLAKMNKSQMADLAWKLALAIVRIDDEDGSWPSDPGWLMWFQLVTDK